MEKVCVYIQQELQSTAEPVDQRLIVAEVAIIDRQIMSMAAGLINIGSPYGSDHSDGLFARFLFFFLS
jgi:hypothetical protein